ncbi:DUF2171 domain-containing protein [Novosphingobium sp. 1949]|uniref:DUF2171 domain-containing protein n=1 Tax=Novosphingobium organovorum TaxID=2930092 RepID=A0ABT0BB62_9SPHN|nr:DUF2171 domain-containing protein [Novosphingobium organovorum]MCJ2182088.1 DUF2171 domain-containing protein [Novosphingobium organovorum]
MTVDTPFPTEPETAWTTVAGTIRKGMNVIDAEGTCLGQVETLVGDEVMLAGDGGHGFIALSQIDGVGEKGVLLSDRGDAMFGMAS